ncbi:TraR/DksA family transcriptional regulator [Geobacter sp.]|uniref:TraR/DksA family transcriptional regulator n=1 Tax=Geobacter sp. TaxID=46610 RepID=UPI002624748B|nr:TraR/DksA family transcriptional regulator [Geobacter sp.]
MVEKQEEMKALLLKAKEEILAGISKAMKSGSETTTGEPTGDIYDQASSERDRELGLLLNDRERDKLRQIDEALLRIEDGEYGICEECEEEIPLGRLKVMPFARFCVRCQSEMEKLQAQTRRFEEDRAYREISFNEEEEG